jgi:pyruvate dehydrogenase E1 component alpha subunit
MQNKDNVVMCFFGDGATNEGAFHEAVNLAAIWNLPVVFVCENNKYGMSFSTEKSMKVDHIAERAVAYGIPGVTVEGNDVDAVYAAAQEAVDRARRGDGPTLVENITYRWKGHSKSDKNLYRSKEEIDDWKALDPIVAFENKVESAGVLNREEIEKIQNDMRDQIRVAIQEATQAPDSDPAELLASVFRQVNS